MGNIIDYARTETRDFGELPFREADALVLAQLSYDDVPECVPRLDDIESRYGTLRDRVKQFDVRRPIRSLHMLRKLPFNGVTIARADDELNHDQAVPDHDVENVGLVDPQVTHDFYHAVASNPRFSDIEMGAFLEQFDGEEQTQFAAVTYLLPSGALVVAYRGTDDSLVGWKEDFNMAFQYPVPAQATAADYLARVAALWKDVPIVLTGHSKGGNLAVYAAMNASDEVKDRVERIYSLDGPGFPESVVNSFEYASVSDRQNRSGLIGGGHGAGNPRTVHGGQIRRGRHHAAFRVLLADARRRIRQSRGRGQQFGDFQQSVERVAVQPVQGRARTCCGRAVRGAGGVRSRQHLRHDGGRTEGHPRNARHICWIER